MSAPLYVAICSTRTHLLGQCLLPSNSSLRHQSPVKCLALDCERGRNKVEGMYRPRIKTGGR